MTEFKVGDKVTIVDWGAQCPSASDFAKAAECTKFVGGYSPVPQDKYTDGAYHADGEIKYICAGTAITVVDIGSHEVVILARGLVKRDCDDGAVGEYDYRSSIDIDYYRSSIDIDDYYGSSVDIEDWPTRSELEGAIRKMGVWGTAIRRVGGWTELPSIGEQHVLRFVGNGKGDVGVFCDPITGPVEKTYEQKLAEMRQAMQAANDVYGRGDHAVRMSSKACNDVADAYLKATEHEDLIDDIMANLRDDKFWDEQDCKYGD